MEPVFTSPGLNVTMRSCSSRRGCTALKADKMTPTRTAHCMLGDQSLHRPHRKSIFSIFHSCSDEFVPLTHEEGKDPEHAQPFSGFYSRRRTGILGEEPNILREDPERDFQRDLENLIIPDSNLLSIKHHLILKWSGMFGFSPQRLRLSPSAQPEIRSEGLSNGILSCLLGFELSSSL